MVGNNGLGSAGVNLAFADQAIGFGDEGGADQAVIMEGNAAGGAGDFGGGRDEPLEMGFKRAAGFQRVGAVVSLGKVPPGVVVFVL